MYKDRFVVQVRGDWEEKLCLYIAAVAASGERKSAVFRLLLAPLYEYERERQMLEKTEVLQSKMDLETLKKKLHRAQELVVKKNDPLAESEMRRLTEELANFTVKNEFRLLADDTSVEKLISIMADQGGSLSVVSPEGGVFGLMRGRYNDHTNIDVFLKGHDGEPYTVDRIKRESEHIDMALLAIILAVQPSVLVEIMQHKELNGRGLIPRFLFALCQSSIGHRDVNPSAIPESAKQGYNEAARLRLRNANTNDRGIIRLSLEAMNRLNDYAAKVENRLGPDGDLFRIRNWGGKLVGTMIRIAGLIHAWESPSPAEMLMPGDCIERAVQLAEYYASNAMGAYKAAGDDPNTQAAKHILNRLIKLGNESVSLRDLYRACGAKFPTVNDMNPGIQILVDHGFVQTGKSQTGGKGRPSYTVFLNPKELSQGTEVAAG
jgi:hypothetical protein